MTTQCHSSALAGKRGVTPAIKRAFHCDLHRWYRRYHRKLPWRATRNPYRIWVSEVMLQQTRVEVVRAYYERWLRTFPTIESLAKAPHSRVLKIWEGLGYYSRARNLHRAARVLTRQSEGNLPKTSEELQELPGIGRYTAGAIASIAFGRRVPLVDGNVARVFARILAIRADVTKPSVQKQLWAVAEEILPDREVGTFNQSLMELGALVCTPVNPRCDSCPMACVCLARSEGRQHELPIRGGRRTPKRILHDVALVQCNGYILMQRRPSKGLLAGMWELPPLDSKQHSSRSPLLKLRHTITNSKITLRVFACRTQKEVKSSGRLRWILRSNLERFTLPSAYRRALRLIFPATGQISGNCCSPAADISFRKSGYRSSNLAGARTSA